METWTINSKSIKDQSGELIVFEDGVEHFKTKRFFFVHAEKDCTRGRHAHVKCQQIVICVKGQVKVSLDNGSSCEEKILTKNSAGLLIQRGIWSEQTYKGGSTLLVLCDQKYSESDYIRNYEQYLDWKKKTR